MEEVFRGSIDDDVVLQASKPGNAIALLVIGVARLDDFGKTGRPHDFADGHSGEVGIGHHPDAHRGIDGEIFHAGQCLPVFQLRNRRFGQPKIAWSEQPFGT